MSNLKKIFQRLITRYFLPLSFPMNVTVSGVISKFYKQQVFNLLSHRTTKKKKKKSSIYIAIQQGLKAEGTGKNTKSYSGRVLPAEFKCCYLRASLVAQRLKHLPGMWETWVRNVR